MQMGNRHVQEFPCCTIPGQRNWTALPLIIYLNGQPRISLLLLQHVLAYNHALCHDVSKFSTKMLSFPRNALVIMSLHSNRRLTRKMAQQIKVFSLRICQPEFFDKKPHNAEQEHWPPKLCPDLYIYIIACKCSTHTPKLTQTHRHSTLHAHTHIHTHPLKKRMNNNWHINICPSVMDDNNKNNDLVWK